MDLSEFRRYLYNVITTLVLSDEVVAKLCDTTVDEARRLMRALAAEAPSVFGLNDWGDHIELVIREPEEAFWILSKKSGGGEIDMAPARPTPLALLVRILSQNLGIDPPVARSPHELRELARRFAISRREREVAEYLIRASAGGGAPGTGKGSLKNILWLLRDRAGGDYEELASYLIRLVLDNFLLPLDEHLAARIRDDPVIGRWAQKALEQPPAIKLAENLICHEFGGWLVAFNATSMNLLKPAVLAGSALYVASSTDGRGVRTAVLKAIRESGFPLELLGEIAREAGGKWIQPYPDLMISTENAPDLGALVGAVNRVLSRSA